MRFSWPAYALVATGFGCQALVTLSGTPVESSPDAGIDAAIEAATEAAADAAPWSCLPSLPSAPVEDKSAKLNLRRRYAAYGIGCSDERRIPGLRVKACVFQDPGCSSPEAMETTDCEGYVDLPLHRGFVGYLLVLPPPRDVDAGPNEGWPDVVRECFARIDAENVASGRVDPCIRLEDAGAGDPPRIPVPTDLLPLIDGVSALRDEDSLPPGAPITYDQPVFSQAALENFTKLVGQPFRLDAGHFLGLAYDCNANWAKGVTAELLGRDSGLAFYTDSNEIPTINATATSDKGDLGFINLDVGDAGELVSTLVAQRADTGEKIGTYQILLKAGHFSRMDLKPRPQ